MPPPHDHDHHHHHSDSDSESDFSDYDWHELPPHMKDAARTLGWEETLWDEDGKAHTEDTQWDQLTHEQRKAAENFGYHPKLWNEGKGHKHKHKHHPPHHHHHHDHHHGHHDDHKPDHKPEAKETKEEEKKEEKKDNEEEDVPDVSKLDVNEKKEEAGSSPKEETADSGTKEETDDSGTKEETTDGKQDSSNKKPQFKLSKSYGGDGGKKFDHGTNRHISKITVHADGHVVKGLEISYAHGTKTAGSTRGKGTSFELARGEFITSVQVRSNKFVQSLAFQTNKGNLLGPVGGKGWTKLNPLGNDTEGEEVKAVAPFKYQLCGITGSAGDYVDQIAFRWGPVPQQANKQNK